ncbi:MAG: hypothetical protein EBV37_03690 [Actinobacteria bacterium]|nr:hypothetical protein [Actinomycetota bacterium]
MSGRLATECVEISNDPSCLDQGGFWAVVNTFEGKWICARFETVIDSKLPLSNWQGVSQSWQSSQSQSVFENNVNLIRKKIALGDIYQVNLCRVLTSSSNQSLLGLAGKLQKSNPAPFASYLSVPGLEIASASPELFLERKGEVIKTTPIKGTSKSDDFGEKDRAENVMIVDLMRNDFGAICVPGSVDVPRLLASESHPGLYHLVSDITGRLKSGLKWSELLSCLLPAGSISGAPKSAALKVIKEVEKIDRGPYCGVIGWVDNDQALLFGQAKLRLVVLSDGNWFVSLEPLSPALTSICLTKFEAPIFTKVGLAGNKSTSYGLSMLAVRTAKALGFDDSIFVNEDGFVVETGFSNLLILKGSNWQTPALKTGCLPGVIRELLIKWFDISECEITYNQLLASDALYVTSSLRLIQPVRRVDDKLFDENLLGNELIDRFKAKLFSNINP